ncbi:MAG: thiamine phosphate synthase [Rickettsiales bacterium]|jgi:thiamine-phosphate pyrophosphorylase|nr:thiamine phosphate synthase [Rickettsiales bacterium]
MKSKIDYSLYLVTNRDLMVSSSLEMVVEESIKGGVTLVQLREKHALGLEFYNLGKRIKSITQKYGVPLIINDRIDVAQAVDADGVHIGQKDLPVAEVRKILGNNKIVGVSASNLQEAIEAEVNGADYLGVGAMYPTTTKGDAECVTMEELSKIRTRVKIPIVVIGGINDNNIPNFRGTGIDGVAVVSAIMSAKNTKNAAEKLKNLIKMF